jgi:hypothetical protein
VSMSCGWWVGEFEGERDNRVGVSSGLVVGERFGNISTRMAILT